jgi:hypothetical protein
VQLRDAEPAIITRDARLVVVGNGTPDQARILREDLDFRGTLWVDEGMVAYAAAGLKRGPGAVLSWRLGGHLLRALRAGHRQRGVQGDPWQLGGAFVVAAPGRVVYAHTSGEAGDHAPLAELMVALERAARGEAGPRRSHGQGPV